MNAKQDADLLRGRGGDDSMFGDDLNPPDTSTDGDDEVIGNDGRDDMTGFGGSDLLQGFARGDNIDAEENSANLLTISKLTVASTVGPVLVTYDTDLEVQRPLYTSWPAGGGRARPIDAGLYSDLC